MSPNADIEARVLLGEIIECKCHRPLRVWALRAEPRPRSRLSYVNCFVQGCELHVARRRMYYDPKYGATIRELYDLLGDG